MFARKLEAEVLIGGERKLTPLDWLDSFCMRNFTGSAEFDDTLPKAEGLFKADPNHTLSSREKKHRFMLKLEQSLGVRFNKKHYTLVR